MLMTHYEHDMIHKELKCAQGSNKMDLNFKLIVLLAVSNGMIQREVAETYGVPLRTLEYWINKYRNEGIKALEKGPYPGRKPLLTSEQLNELKEMVAKGPEKAGFDTGVWTASLIAGLIKKCFGVSYSQSHVRRLLHKLGFSQQYPRQQPAKADPKLQEDWVTNKLPEIIEKTEKENAALMYEDEVSFRQSGTIHKTWALKGQGCEIQNFSGRRSVRVLGGLQVNDESQFVFHFADKFNSDSFIEFLEKVVISSNGIKVHMIADNASYHKSSAVKLWLAEHQQSIELHNLPPYSPKLNPIERLWKKN